MAAGTWGMGRFRGSPCTTRRRGPAVIDGCVSVKWLVRDALAGQGRAGTNHTPRTGQGLQKDSRTHHVKLGHDADAAQPGKLHDIGHLPLQVPLVGGEGTGPQFRVRAALQGEGLFDGGGSDSS